MSIVFLISWILIAAAGLVVQDWLLLLLFFFFFHFYSHGFLKGVHGQSLHLLVITFHQNILLERPSIPPLHTPDV